MGSFVGSPDSTKLNPINVLVANPAPSTTILVASADVTVRGVDCRTFQLTNEMKVQLLDIFDEKSFSIVYLLYAGFDESNRVDQVHSHCT